MERLPSASSIRGWAAAAAAAASAAAASASSPSLAAAAAAASLGGEVPLGLACFAAEAGARASGAWSSRSSTGLVESQRKPWCHVVKVVHVTKPCIHPSAAVTWPRVGAGVATRGGGL
jgi:uncharacterized membrane protein